MKLCFVVDQYLLLVKRSEGIYKILFRNISNKLNGNLSPIPIKLVYFYFSLHISEILENYVQPSNYK